MKIVDIVEALGLEVKVEGDLSNEVNGCYISDMLSDVLANCNEGSLWITQQTHPNVIYVASIRGIPGIIISGNKAITTETLGKAEEEDITVMVTHLPTFETAGALYSLFSKQGTER